MRQIVLLAVLALVGCGGDDSGGGASGAGGSAGIASGGTSSGGSASGGTSSGGTESGGSAGTASGGSSGAGGSGGACVDSCPTSSAGVTWGCKKRFMVGTNWAWNQWGADFGGISAWGSKGVSAGATDFSNAMGEMQSGGVNVIRWWMFPRFLSDGIDWGSDDAPSGISGSLAADVQKALELAEQHDVYLMLTPFSFDNFKATATEAGLLSRGIQPMVTNATLRKKLLDNLVVPVAQAVESSPYKHRMIAWDLINEPEWAVSGANKYGGEAFDPDTSLQTVSHDQMETFLNELAAALRAHSTALLSVGGAAIKWYDAWLKVDQDFYMFHYYDWVYQYYPYTTHNPQTLGLTKPVVIGEFPTQGLSAVGSADKVLDELWQYGFAGGLTWAYNDSSFPWSSNTLGTFTAKHACETKY